MRIGSHGTRQARGPAGERDGRPRALRALRRSLALITLPLLALLVAAVDAQLAPPAPPRNLIDFAGQVGGPSLAALRAGDRLYRGEGSQVVVLDLSDPERPREIGRSRPLPGELLALARTDDGDRIFVATGGPEIYVLDVRESQEGEPRVIEVIELEQDGLDVSSTGDLLCVAAGSRGSLLFDISVQRQSRELDRFSTVYTSRIACRGEFAYHVGHSTDDELRRLNVSDLSDPENVRPVGRFRDPVGDRGTNVLDIVLLEDTIALAEGERGMTLLGLTESGALEPLLYTGDGTAWQVASVGDLIVGVGDELHVYDDSTRPALPGQEPWRHLQRVGHVAIERYPLALAGGDQHAYVGATQVDPAGLTPETTYQAAGPLAVVSLADPTAPEEILRLGRDGWGPGGPALAVENTIYLGTDRDVQLYEPTNHGTPRWLSALTVPGGVQAMARVGDRLYVLSREGASSSRPALRALDVRDPRAPRLEDGEGAVLALAGDAGADLIVAGRDRLVALTSGGLEAAESRLHDIALEESGAMALRAERDLATAAQGLAFHESGRLFIAASALLALDTDRIAEGEIEVVDGAPEPGFRGAWAGGGTLYGIVDPGIRVYDIHDPTAPDRLIDIQIEDVVQGLLVEGDQLFAYGRHLTVMDVSLPQQPRGVSRWELPSFIGPPSSTTRRRLQLGRPAVMGSSAFTWGNFSEQDPYGTGFLGLRVLGETIYMPMSGRGFTIVPLTPPTPTPEGTWATPTPTGTWSTPTRTPRPTRTPTPTRPAPMPTLTSPAPMPTPTPSEAPATPTTAGTQPTPTPDGATPTRTPDAGTTSPTPDGTTPTSTPGGATPTPAGTPETPTSTPAISGPLARPS